MFGKLLEPRIRRMKRTAADLVAGLDDRSRLLALELQHAVQSLAHKTRQQGERVYLSASTAVVMAVNEAPDELLKRLNLTLVRAKPPRSKRA